MPEELSIKLRIEASYRDEGESQLEAHRTTIVPYPYGTVVVGTLLGQTTIENST